MVRTDIAPSPPLTLSDISAQRLATAGQGSRAKLHEVLLTVLSTALTVNAR